MNNVNNKNPIKIFVAHITRYRTQYEPVVDVTPFDTIDEAEDAFEQLAYEHGIYLDPDQDEFTYGNGAEKDDEWFECTVKIVSTDKYEITYKIELA